MESSVIQCFNITVGNPQSILLPTINYTFSRSTDNLLISYYNVIQGNAKHNHIAKFINIIRTNFIHITEKVPWISLHYNFKLMISFCVLNILYSAYNTCSEKDMTFVLLGVFELTCIFTSLFVLSKLVLWIDKILFKKVFIIHMWKSIDITSI